MFATMVANFNEVPKDPVTLIASGDGTRDATTPSSTVVSMGAMAQAGDTLILYTAGTASYPVADSVTGIPTVESPYGRRSNDNAVTEWIGTCVGGELDFTINWSDIIEIKLYCWALYRNVGRTIPVRALGNILATTQASWTGAGYIEAADGVTLQYWYINVDSTSDRDPIGDVGGTWVRQGYANGEDVARPDAKLELYDRINGADVEFAAGISQDYTNAFNTAFASGGITLIPKYRDLDSAFDTVSVVESAQQTKAAFDATNMVFTFADPLEVGDIVLLGHWGATNSINVDSVTGVTMAADENFNNANLRYDYYSGTATGGETALTISYVDNTIERAAIVVVARGSSGKTNYAHSTTGGSGYRIWSTQGFADLRGLEVLMVAIDNGFSSGVFSEYPTGSQPLETITFATDYQARALIAPPVAHGLSGNDYPAQLLSGSISSESLMGWSLEP